MKSKTEQSGPRPTRGPSRTATKGGAATEPSATERARVITDRVLDVLERVDLDALSPSKCSDTRRRP